MSHLGPSLRRRRRPTRTWTRLAAAVLVSLLVNAALVRLVRFGILHAPVAVQRSVDIAPLSSRAWEANRAVTDASPADPSRRAAEILAQLSREERPPPPATPGQVVDVAPSKDSRPPKDSRFVSDRDNTVEKETISRNRKAGYASTQPAPTDPGAAAKRAAAPAGAAGANGDGAKPGRGAREGSAAGQTVRREAPRKDERLALQLDRFGEHVAPREDRKPPAPDAGAARGDPLADEPGAAGGRPGAPGALDRSKLAPSAETYDRLAGGPAPDHVSGVEEGEGTFLNTREWKYASYFNRIKQAVANTWDPNRALAIRDPDGRRFAYRDRHTLVAVRLDDAGSLKDVEVVKSSGVDFLDQIALDAFRRAQPFVNPPRGLADPRGEIAFTFGFYLEVGGGFRMYRAQQ